MINELYQNDLESILSCDLPWNNLSGKNILVTGGTGLIGSCIIDVLMKLNDVNVFCMGRSLEKAKNRFKDYFDNPRFNFICHDITNKLDLDIDFDYIIHAASGAHPAEFNNRPVETMTGNFIGTFNLLKYGKIHNMKRFIYISSGEVYGAASSEVDSFSEGYSGYVDCTKVRACYPSSKRASETLLESFISEYDIDGVIARPCHVFGPTMTSEDSRVVAEFIRYAVNGTDIILRSRGNQMRSYLYVVDAVLAIFYVLFKGLNKEAYNICGKDRVSIRELAEIIADISNGKVVAENDIDVRERAILNCDKLYNLGFRENNSLRGGLEKTIMILKN